MERLHKTSNIEIYHDPDTNILLCNWIGFQDEKSLKQAGLIIHTLLIQNRCTKVLNDNTQVIGSWSHSATWTTNEWFPAMIEAGLEKFAWVFATDIPAQVSVYKVSPAVSVVKTFVSREQALAWLLE